MRDTCLFYMGKWSLELKIPLYNYWQLLVIRRVYKNLSLTLNGQIKKREKRFKKRIIKRIFFFEKEEAFTFWKERESFFLLSQKTWHPYLLHSSPFLSPRRLPLNIAYNPYNRDSHRQQLSASHPSFFLKHLWTTIRRHLLHLPSQTGDDAVYIIVAPTLIASPSSFSSYSPPQNHLRTPPPNNNISPHRRNFPSVSPSSRDNLNNLPFAFPPSSSTPLTNATTSINRIRPLPTQPLKPLHNTK